MYRYMMPNTRNKRILTCSLLVVVLMCAVAVIKPAYAIVLSAAIVAVSLFMMDSRILFVAVILLLEKFLYFFDVMEYIPYFYYPAQLLSLFLILLAVFNIRKIIEYDYVFKGPFLALFIAYVAACITPAYTLGQSLPKAIFPLLLQFGVMGYFLFVFLFREFKKTENILNIIMVMGFIISLLFIIQFFLYPKFVFLDLSYSLRYGDVRIHEIGGLLPFSFFVLVDRALRKKVKLFTVVNLLVHVFTLFYISKARVMSFAIIIALLVILVLQKKVSRKFIATAALLSILLIVSIFLIFNIGLDYISDFFNEMAVKGGTAGIRIEAVDYFIKLVKENPVFGIGFFNIADSEAYFLSGRDYGMFISDVGLVGYSVLFGLLGIIAFMYLWGRGLLIAIRMYKTNPVILFPLAYVIFNLVSSATIAWLYLTPTNIYIAIFFAYCDVIYNKMKKREINESPNGITGTVPAVDGG